ncbi:hypothetical protein N658DRAFT_495735 [Parathielavia hyrcaniae]|uniref:CENP-C homolog n=1 Tax=Parathielavia hyrcaniae TaxID=113614 RepID=A0AAN6T1M5_9PEZI|nr:hypothetical protein N658DRAFT_495735 [Parathielavia hyrcaniae]
MAPRPSLARRTLAPQGEHIYELGVVGRKTGVTVPDSGVRDEHGMEPIENLFSSPAKSDNEEEQAEASDDYGSGEEEDMDITTGSGLGPATILNGHGSRLPVPSHVRSPAKKLLNSPAQRNRLVARNSSSPARGAIVRDDGSRSSSQPTGDQAATKRRLDFRSVANGGPHSLSQPLGAAKGPANGRRLQPLQYDDEDEEEAGEHGRDEVDDFVEESMAMLDGGDDFDLPAQSEGEEEQISMLEDEDPRAPAARKKPGQPPKQKEAAASKPMKAQKRSAKPVVEELEEDDDHQEGDEHGESEGQEEEEQAVRPQKPAPGRRGRPPKAADTASSAPQPPARASRKRRSLGEEEDAAAQEPSPEPQPKRQRTSPATTTTTGKKPAPPKKPAASTALTKKTPEPPAAATTKGRGRKRKSPPADPGDVSQVAIARRPPLPRSRGLLINRRTEVPGDPSSSMLRTRSGRTSFKPLAYWRNERVEFDKDEADDAFAGGRPKKFVLSSVKEVVRVDEPEPEVRHKSFSSSRRGGGAAKRGGKGRGRRRSSQVYEEEEGEDGPAEVWELDPGTVTGEVVVWQPEYEFSPPAPNDLVSVMDKQLAISGPAIKTTEVVGGDFRYAKVFSEGFIGAGVVDLPPGAIKRLKNSRKVFMIFFVHAGKVLVTVQETDFRISKGGIFIVPRYNEYTIENDNDRPARIFFAQGQEMPATLPPDQDAEGDGGDDDGDVDEEVEVSEGEEIGSGE